MKIQALGGCCKRSLDNYQAVLAAVKELGIEAEVEHVTSMEEIMNLGVMATPGLVIDGKVMAVGRPLSVAQAKELIQAACKHTPCGCKECK